MAGRHFARWRLIAALALAVGLLHWAALAWLARQWSEPSVLRAMATPMFTRTLSATPPKAPDTRVRAPRPHTRPAPPPQVPTTAAASSPENPPEAAQAAPEPPAPPIRPLEEAAPPAFATPPEPRAATPTEEPGDSWPVNTRLHYVVGGNYRGALHGDAQVQWQREGQRYQVQLEVNIGWLAHLAMTSQGLVTPGELRPEAFEELSGLNRRHVSFTPQEMVFMNGARQAKPEGVQDTVSQFVELTHRFAQASPALAVGQSVQFWLARPGGADAWTYDVVELQTLDTPRLGAVPAFHLKPRPLANPRGPITAEIWFAPSLQYLPVRIRITLNEQTWVDLLVDKVEQSAPP
jgi:hypothetical protein